MLLNEIVPYTEIWFDCKKNLEISILQSIDNNNKNVVYNNSYEYYDRAVVTGSKKDFNVITINTVLGIEGNLFHNPVSIIFNDNQELLNKIKGLLNENKFVFPSVDLYYWNKENLCYQRNHWYHRTLIQGYDKEKDCFWVFDASMGNEYGIFAVSSEDFVNAVNMSDVCDGKVITYDLNENTAIRNITGSILRSNAIELINNIEKMEKKIYWEMPDEDFRFKSYLDYNYSCLTQVVQRQKANLNLFNKIDKMNLLDNTEMNGVIDSCTKAIKKWDIIRNFLYKLYYFTEYNSGIININKMVKDVFSMEKHIWEAFLQITGNMDDNFEFFSFNKNQP